MNLSNIQNINIQDIKEIAIILFFIIFGLNYFINFIYKDRLNNNSIIKEKLLLFEDTIDLVDGFASSFVLSLTIGSILFFVMYLTRDDVNLFFADENVSLTISMIIFLINIFLSTKKIKYNRYIKLLNKLMPLVYGLFIANNLLLIYADKHKNNKYGLLYFIIIGIACYYIYCMSETFHKMLHEMELRKEARYYIYLSREEKLYGNILWQDETFYLIANKKDDSKHYINKSNIYKIVQDKSKDSNDKTNDYVKEVDKNFSYSKISRQKIGGNFTKLLVKYKKQILILMLTIVLIPMSIDYFIIGNNIYSNISNSDWIGFLGGYIGSIIGAITTLVGVYLTLIENRKEKNEEYKLNNRAFLNVSDTYSENLQMRDLAYKFEGDKILLTDVYEKKLKEGYTGQCQFITLTNYGPGIIVGGVFKLFFEKDGNINEMTMEIPNINKDEIIHIPVAQEGEAFARQIILTYRTLGKEKIIFTRMYTKEKVMNENYKYELMGDDTIEKEKSALSWIYVKSDKK